MASLVIQELHTALTSCWAFRSENVTQFENWVNLQQISDTDQETLVGKITQYIEGNTEIPLGVYPLKTPSELTDTEKTNVYKEREYNYYEMIDAFRRSVLDAINWDFEMAWGKTYDGVYFVFPETTGSLEIKGIFFKKYDSSSANSLFGLFANRLDGKLTFTDNEEYTFLPNYQDEYGDNVKWRLYWQEPVVYIYPNQTIETTTHESLYYEIATKTVEINRKDEENSTTIYPYTKDVAVKLNNGHTLKDMVDSSFMWDVAYSAWGQTGNMTVKEMLDNIAKYKKLPRLDFSLFFMIYNASILGDFDYTWGVAWDYTTVQDGVGCIYHIEFKNESLHGNLVDPVIYDVTQDEWVIQTYTFDVTQPQQ